MLNDRIARLIAVKLSGEATDNELRELAAHYLACPADQYFEELLASYWKSQADHGDQPDAHAEEHFLHILGLANTNTSEAVHIHEMPVIRPRGQKRKWLIRGVSIAAVSISVLFGARQLVQRNTSEPVQDATEKNEIIAKRGTRSKLLLPDGSKVWLNSDTRLVYSNTFSDTLREVQLEGEAYFDVVKDAKRPFVVHTSGLDIRVLGTAFNVKSYTSEPTIEATLIHGMIEVIRKDQPEAPRLILRPHQKLLFERHKTDVKKSVVKTIKPETIDTDAAISITTLPKNLQDTSIIETSWVYNKLSFEGELFSDVAVKMERWFNVKIVFGDEQVANYRLRGSFINETIEEALKALQLSIPFSYKINNNTVKIDKK